MIDFGIARALHVISIVLWIGGVGMVTTVLLPSIRRTASPARWFAAFDAMESRFAAQARWTTTLAGATGFYMVWRIDAWDRFASGAFWWMHAMVFTWMLFTLMLFVAEPWFLRRVLERRAARAPEAAFRLVERLHGVLLVLSLLTVAGAAAGAVGVDLLGF
jgi:uncharacterized membrane protein